MVQRLRRNVQQFMNIAYGPKLKVKLRFPEYEFFNILPMNHPLVKNKLVSERNRFRRNRYSLMFNPKNKQNIKNFYTIYGRVKNNRVVSAPFRNIANEPFMRRAGQISNAVTKVQRAYRKYRLAKKVKNRSARKIQTVWRYSPGGPEYRAAKARFESMSLKN